MLRSQTDDDMESTKSLDTASVTKTDSSSHHCDHKLTHYSIHESIDDKPVEITTSPQ